LNANHIEEVSTFYDRNGTIDQWYYQGYASSILSAVPKPSAFNCISVVRDHNLPPITGPVLVLKNGPVGGLWETDKDLLADDVARTIWWYHASGNEVAKVRGERELSRFLKTHL
jgi:hypothetical protein